MRIMTIIVNESMTEINFDSIDLDAVVDDAVWINGEKHRIQRTHQEGNTAHIHLKDPIVLSDEEGQLTYGVVRSGYECHIAMSNHEADDQRVRNCLVVANEELADAIHHATDLNEENDFGDEEEMVKHISNAHSILGQALEEYQSK